MSRRRFLGTAAAVGAGVWGAGRALPAGAADEESEPRKPSLTTLSDLKEAAMSQPAKLVLDAQATLGEGPFWDADKQVLYWLDIEEFELHVFNPASQEDRTIKLDQHIGTVVPRDKGGVMLALHKGFASLDLETERLTIINDPEAHLPRTRFNDGKCDPAGRFWAGTLSLDHESEAGNLYFMDKDLSVTRVLGKVSVSNGINWSLDNKTMYYIDTPTMRIDAFDYDLATGAIGNRRPIVEINKEVGYPDGMTIDSEGMLWMAPWGSGMVGRWNPDTGELIESVEVPAKQVTACAFGGPNLDELYVTSAKIDVGMPLGDDAGGLFMAKPGVKGVKMPGFAG